MNRYPSGRFVAALVTAWLAAVSLAACVPDKPCKQVVMITTAHDGMTTSYCAEYEK